MVDQLKALFIEWKNRRYMVINKIPNELRPKVTAFLNAVDVHFSFLSDYGYLIKEERIATEYAVDNIIEVRYKNEDLDRVIIIHYEPKSIDNKDVNLISVSFFNGIKFLNRELGLEYYLKKYKPEFDLEHLTYFNRNSKATFEENIQTSIAGFAYLLQDTGINLVDGSEWEDGLTFDWSSAEKILYEAQKKIIYGDDKSVK